jgi:hypothetical protein
MALISLSTTIGRRSAGRLYGLRQWWRTLLPARRFGAVRTVFITRRYVFKLPGRWQWQHWRWWWDAFLRGLLSNMQERTFAAQRWPELCPVCFSIPGGFLVVMPRTRPLTYAEWQGFDYRAFVSRGDDYVEDNFDSYAGTWAPGALGQPLHVLVLGNAEPSIGLVPAEYKPDSFGVLNRRIVAIDYG